MDGISQRPGMSGRYQKKTLSELRDVSLLKYCCGFFFSLQLIVSAADLVFSLEPENLLILLY